MLTFLAVVLAGQLTKVPPQILAPAPSLVACLVTAEQLNNKRTADQVVKGEVFVCLELKEFRV